MIKVEYITIVDESTPDRTNPERIAKKLEEKINSIQSSSLYPRTFLCSNFLGTEAAYSSFPPKSNTGHTSYYQTYTPDNTLYQFMLFFDEHHS